MKAVLLLFAVWLGYLLKGSVCGSSTGSGISFFQRLQSAEQDPGAGASIHAEIVTSHEPFNSYMGDIFDILELEKEYGERKIPVPKTAEPLVLLRSIFVNNVLASDAAMELEFFILENDLDDSANHVGATWVTLVLPRTGWNVEDHWKVENWNVTFTVYERMTFTKNAYLERRTVSGMASGYEEFDVTDAFLRHVSRQAAGFTIHLTCEDTRPGHRNSSCADYFDFAVSEQQSPLLAIYSGIEPAKWIPSRKRRTPKIRVPRARNPPAYATGPDDCDVMETYVTYEQIGWIHVLKPEGVVFQFCKGKCPLPLLLPIYNSSSHSFMMSFYKKRHPDTPPPEPKCVPTKYECLQQMVREFKRHVVKTHCYALAAACGCL